ncbi:hypothetical protein EON71_00915 [bacterium]|nr:MAG: hypothetical protein EON71_00915 [bacterium]
MEEKIRKKFKKFKKYEPRLPGVAQGLNVLKLLNEKRIRESGTVMYYDYCTDEVKSYDFLSLNSELYQVYNIINAELIQTNILHILFCTVYDSLYAKYQYSYYQNRYTKYDVINKFFQGLRKNKKHNSLKFSVFDVIKIYNLRS